MGLKNILTMTIHKYHKISGDWLSTTFNCRQPYHPAAQDWFPTESKQGWDWLVPGWETSWENQVAAGKGVSETSRGCSLCGLCES